MINAELKFPSTNPSALVLERLKNHKTLLFVVGVLWLLWIVYTINRVLARLSSGNTNGMSGFEIAIMTIVMAVIIPLAVLFFVYMAFLKSTRAAYLKDFAQLNRLEYSDGASVRDFQGELFRIGDMGAVTNVIKGNLNGTAFTFCIYSYQINDGRAARQHSVAALNLELGTLVPDMVLEPKKFYFGASLAHGLKKLRTDGSFEAKFNLWTKSEYEIEGLQIFSVGKIGVIEQYDNFALEFVGTSAFIYYPEVINSSEQLQKIFTYADFLISQIKPTLQGMRSGLATMNEQFTPKSI